MKATDAQRARWKRATRAAKLILKTGDRIRVTKCPGTKRTVTFSHWAGDWIVSASGIDDFAASNIDRLNGKPVDFTAPVGKFQGFVEALAELCAEHDVTITVGGYDPLRVYDYDPGLGPIYCGDIEDCTK